MSDGHRARVVLASLLEVLQVAIDKVRSAQATPWKSAEIARSWMENEISPLVDRISEVGISSSCPICRYGEEFVVYPPSIEIWRRRPLGESYTCGHWVRFSVSVLHEADYDVLMPMSSEVSILPNTSVQITNRPQVGAFRPVRIVLGGHPDRWRFDNIIVGNRSQLSSVGSIPGALFSFVAVDPPALSLDMVNTAMDFTFVVTYVGPREEGEPFDAVVLGVAADGDLARRRSSPDLRLAVDPRTTTQAIRCMSRENVAQLLGAWSAIVGVSSAAPGDREESDGDVEPHMGDGDGWG